VRSHYTFGVKALIVVTALVTYGCNSDRCDHKYIGHWTINEVSRNIADSTEGTPILLMNFLNLEPRGLAIVPRSPTLSPARGDWVADCHDSIATITIMNTGTVFDGSYQLAHDGSVLTASSYTRSRKVVLLYSPTIIDQFDSR